MATDALTIMKEKKESLKRSNEKQPTIQQEFYDSVNLQKKEDDERVPHERMATLIDDRLRIFKETWRKEKESEMTKLKKLIDEKFDDIEKSVTDKQEIFEDKISEKIEKSCKSEVSNDRLDYLESKLTDILNKEVKLLQLNQNESKVQTEKHFSEFQEKLSQDQEKFRQDLRSEFTEGLSKLKLEMKDEIEKLSKLSFEEDRKVAEGTTNIKDSKYEQSRDLVEDVFDMKMQSEMNQMKTRLREDFSREVMALEDEIEALRKSYETRDYTTDEGNRFF